MKQLISTIEVTQRFKGPAPRTGLDFKKETIRLEKYKKFLDEITHCDLDDFETLASVWIMSMKRI